MGAFFITTAFFAVDVFADIFFAVAISILLDQVYKETAQFRQNVSTGQPFTVRILPKMSDSIRQISRQKCKIHIFNELSFCEY